MNQVQRKVAEDIQTMDSVQLRAIINGDVDIEWICRKEMASRGLDRHDKWVGFPQAKRIWLMGPSKKERLLAVAKKTLALWEEHGLGDDEAVSGPIYDELKQSIGGLDKKRTTAKGGRTRGK